VAESFLLVAKSIDNFLPVAMDPFIPGRLNTTHCSGQAEQEKQLSMNSANTQEEQFSVIPAGQLELDFPYWQGPTSCSEYKATPTPTPTTMEMSKWADKCWTPYFNPDLKCEEDSPGQIICSKCLSAMDESESEAVESDSSESYIEREE
jgi:hypothetical protein